MLENTSLIERESMAYDVVIVGAGPSGLSTACQLMTLAQKNKYELTVCIVEKGSEVGAHILSGAVIESRALDELFPDWQQKNPKTSMNHKKQSQNRQKTIENHQNGGLEICWAASGTPV